jgi:hypothetical protein
VEGAGGIWTACVVVVVERVREGEVEGVFISIAGLEVGVTSDDKVGNAPR